MRLNTVYFGMTQFWVSLMGLIWFWLHPEELARPGAATIAGLVSLSLSTFIVCGGYFDNEGSKVK